MGRLAVIFGQSGMHPPNVFSEIISKALADHLGFAIFLGTIKGQNQLYKTYQAGTDDSDWFTVWQDIEGSLGTETGRDHHTAPAGPRGRPATDRQGPHDPRGVRSGVVPPRVSYRLTSCTGAHQHERVPRLA